MECKLHMYVSKFLLISLVRIKPKWNVNIKKLGILSLSISVRIKPKWNVNKFTEENTKLITMLE